jgi:hypothetical protein
MMPSLPDRRARPGRQAGLDKAATEFPEDVAAAAEAAAQAQRACAGGGQPTDEPWPPMRARTTS